MPRLKFSQKQRRWRRRQDLVERALALDIAVDQFFTDYLRIVRCQDQMLGLAAREERLIQRYGAPADNIAAMPLISRVCHALETGLDKIVSELAFILWFNVLDAKQLL